MGIVVEGHRKFSKDLQRSNFEGSINIVIMQGHFWTRKNDEKQTKC